MKTNLLNLRTLGCHHTVEQSSDHEVGRENLAAWSRPLWVITHQFASFLLFLWPAAGFAGGLVENTATGYLPLTDLGQGTYLDSEGGLYAGGQNTTPAAHLANGAMQAARIEPLDAGGIPSPDGIIGILTTGISNAEQIFGEMGELMAGRWAPQVTFVNGAQGGMDARLWAEVDGQPWPVAFQRMEDADLSLDQVQVVLCYHAVAHSKLAPQPWPDTPGDLQQFQETIAGHLMDYFPNTRLSFWGTREYGGYVAGGNSPEPYAYQSAFAVKWMLDRQISGQGNNWDASRGAVTAPWMDWGPYCWADGLQPRSDGLLFEPRDFQSDGTHPSARGRAKLAWRWIEFIHGNILTNGLMSEKVLEPFVHIISPETERPFNVGSRVVIEAFAADLDEPISRVDFYANGSFLGSDFDAPFHIGWTHPGYGDYPAYAVAHSVSGQTTTSATMILYLRERTNAGIIAEDGFESRDFEGGGGDGGGAWNGPWTLIGTPGVQSGDAFEGDWWALFGGGEGLTRSLTLTSTVDKQLHFAWRGSIAPGGSFIVEVRDTQWRRVLTANQPATAAWQQVDFDLSTLQPTSNFGFRLQVNGAGSRIDFDALAVIDSARQFLTPAPNLDLRLLAGRALQLQWAQLRGYNTAIEQSHDLATWVTFYETSGSEDSTVSLPPIPILNTAFFRMSIIDD